MANFTPTKKQVSDFNNGIKYVNKVDTPSADDFNNVIESQLYSQNFAEALADAPDISEAGNIGTPSVTLVDNIKIVNGEAITYKKFKFKNMKGEQGVSSDSSTVSFTQATTRANIATGETLAVLMGKIKKWFADLGALAFKANLDYSDLTGKPTLGTVASKNSGTAVGEIPIIGSSGKIDRYILPTANDSGYIGVVAGQSFANRNNKAGATYHEVLIDSAGMAYAFYPNIDTAMSDTSVNLVQNKIVKAYVDTAESSAKAYVDGLVGDIETLLAGV